MEILEELAPLHQSELIVIPIIDVSGSMAGEKIATLNDVFAELPAQLMDINNELFDTKILIAAMEFSTGAKWFSLKDGKPRDVESFRWIDMRASGLSDLGAAFKLLNEKLEFEENGGWMKRRGGLAPIIILVSGGDPTDNYKATLNELKKKWWFNAALKFAVAVDGADKSVLAEFTGNYEAIIDTNIIRCNLASIIKAVYVHRDWDTVLFDDEPLKKEKTLTFDVTGFKCDTNEYTIVTKVLVDLQYSRLLESPYYLVKDIMGNLNVIQIEDTKIKIYDYSRELLKELASKLLDNQIQLKEAFFRGQNKQIYVVYEECDTVKCMIIVREDSSMLDKMDSMESTVFDW